MWALFWWYDVRLENKNNSVCSGIRQKDFQVSTNFTICNVAYTFHIYVDKPVSLAFIWKEVEEYKWKQSYKNPDPHIINKALFLLKVSKMSF